MLAAHTYNGRTFMHEVPLWAGHISKPNMVVSIIHNYERNRSLAFLDCEPGCCWCRTPSEMQGKLTVAFHGEEGIDAGGVTREWYQVGLCLHTHPFRLSPCSLEGIVRSCT